MYTLDWQSHTQLISSFQAYLGCTALDAMETNELDGWPSIFFVLPGPLLTYYIARGSGCSETLPVASYLRGSGWFIYLRDS